VGLSVIYTFCQRCMPSELEIFAALSSAVWRHLHVFGCFQCVQDVGGDSRVLCRHVHTCGRRSQRRLGERRFWFAITWKDRLINMAIDSHKTGEKIDRCTCASPEIFLLYSYCGHDMLCVTQHGHLLIQMQHIRDRTWVICMRDESACVAQDPAAIQHAADVGAGGSRHTAGAAAEVGTLRATATRSAPLTCCRSSATDAAARARLSPFSRAVAGPRIFQLLQRVMAARRLCSSKPSAAKQSPQHT